MSKPHTIIQAEYASLIQPFVSDETTRFYLNGFLAEPRQDGVSIVATDGSVMGIFRDDSGFASAPVIWQLRKDTIKACQPGKRDNALRWLVIDPASAGTPFRHPCRVVEASDPKGAARIDLGSPLVLHLGFAAAIEGTFPDWRRVIPAITGKPTNTSYGVDKLAKFGPVARSRDARNAPLVVHDSEDGRGPALVLTSRNDFAGVMMPVVHNAPWPRSAPAWLAGGHVTTADNGDRIDQTAA